MSINLPSHYVSQFASNLQLLLQQEGSRLRNTVMSGNHVGKQASPVDQIGAIEMQPVSSRFAAMGRVDAAVDRRWVFPSDFDLPQLIDSFDKLRLLTDPQSSYVQNAVAAAGRQIDKLIIAAAIGTAKTGETGATSTVLPTAQKVVVGFGAAADVGLTVAKLKEAKRLLMAADVSPMEELYLPLGATQHDNLLSEMQIISKEFGADSAVLKEGKIQRFLGINFIHTELAVANLVSGDVTLPLYAKSGMYLGIWNDIITDISQRKDIQSIPWQAYVMMTMGATRIEEEKVVQIACNI
jgi:hypothetical protein